MSKADLMTHQRRTLLFITMGVIVVHVGMLMPLLRTSSPIDAPTKAGQSFAMTLTPVHERVTPPPKVPRPSAVPSKPSSVLHSVQRAPISTEAPSSNEVNEADARAAAPEPALSWPRSEGLGLHNAQPVYPKTSRRLNEQGVVVVRVWVSEQGHVQEGHVKTSSGYERLDQEALNTVLRWRFIPGQRGGVAQAMWFNVPVHFVLE